MSKVYLLRIMLLLSLSCASHALFAGFLQAAYAQSQSRATLSPALMTNADVLSLTAAGLAPDIIISRIRSAPSRSFDTSVEALKLLKAAGVPNDVVVVMINGGAPPSPADASSSLTALELKEPVFKEGLWEEHLSSKRSDASTYNFTDHRCHSHAKDHMKFQDELVGKNAGFDSCKVLSASTDGENRHATVRCNEKDIVVIIKLSWRFSDEDHVRFEEQMDIRNSPLMKDTNAAIDMVYQGACPAGVAAGDTVEDTYLPSSAQNAKAATSASAKPERTLQALKSAF